MKYVLSLAAALVIAGTSLAGANTFALTIVNSTGSTVERFYASPVGVTDWEEDLFGDQVLPAGDEITVRFADERDVCEYDLLFEFRGNDLEDLTDTQNLCEVGIYEITE
jgi:hypothetical protein